jgi:hypothetical protein
VGFWIKIRRDVWLDLHVNTQSSKRFFLKKSFMFFCYLIILAQKFDMLHIRATWTMIPSPMEGSRIRGSWLGLPRSTRLILHQFHPNGVVVWYLWIWEHCSSVPNNCFSSYYSVHRQMDVVPLMSQGVVCEHIVIVKGSRDIIVSYTPCRRTHVLWVGFNEFSLQ